MRSRFRLLSIVVLALLLLALPGGGLAADPKDPLREPGSGPTITLPGGNAVLAPALVPGATVRAVGLPDAFPWNYGAGATVVGVDATTINYEYNSAGGAGIMASLGLPAGTTLWQLDVYGYASGATTQAWALYDQNVTTGDVAPSTLPATSTGPGIVHGTQSFSGGVTLAAGHDWFLYLNSTSSTSGYVGAIFQYTLPTLSFVPITPARVLDSRPGAGHIGATLFHSKVKQTVLVANGTSGVPTTAGAVTGNVTVVGQTHAGYVTVAPSLTSGVQPPTSTINFPLGDTRANGVTVPLAAGGNLDFMYWTSSTGPTVNIIFDVTGYFSH